MYFGTDLKKETLTLNNSPVLFNRGAECFLRGTHRFLIQDGEINEQCTYRFEMGNLSRTESDKLSNVDNSSALHLQICATRTLISLLP